MTRPLVSIVTPTIPERHDLLMGCIDNVRHQDYPTLEHVIVSDGPDPDLWGLIDRQACRLMEESDRRHPVDADVATLILSRPRVVPLHYRQLGRRWSPLFPVYAIGVAPLLTGFLMARGEYLMVLCDDERMTPDHVSSLVDVLEEQRADFAYSKVRMWPVGSSPERGYDIGSDPPAFGQITNFLFRADMLTRAAPRFDMDTFNDWFLVREWMARGATWAFVPRVSISHRADR